MSSHLGTVSSSCKLLLGLLIITKLGYEADTTPLRRSSLTRHSRSARIDLSWTKNENYGIIFVYSDEFNKTEIAVLTESIAEIRNYSCIPVKLYSESKMTKIRNLLSSGNGRDSSDLRLFKNYVEITRNSGYACQSFVGMQSGRQRLNLNPQTGCTLEKKTVVHEMIHALGYHHEQSRPDRDQYIKIDWDNVQSNEEGNFQIDPLSVAVGPYDFESIMHYPSSSHAKDYNLPVIESKVEGVTVSPTIVDKLSDLDREKIRFITGCKSKLKPVPLSVSPNIVSN